MGFFWQKTEPKPKLRPKVIPKLILIPWQINSGSCQVSNWFYVFFWQKTEPKPKLRPKAVPKAEDEDSVYNMEQ